MARPVTLFTGQWADLPFETICKKAKGFGDPRRFWDFRSLGRGSINFEEVICALNEVGYTGQISIEWEDSGMDREHGTTEACAFDAAFEKQRGLVSYAR
jgi:hypothetical protein